MKSQSLKRRKFWLRFVAAFVALPVVLVGVLLLIVHAKHDDIIQAQVEAMNTEHKGLVFIGDTHLELFARFPDISVKVDEVRIVESKSDDATVILQVADIYAGFNLWDMVAGNYDVHSLLVEDGFFNIVLHEDGSNNLQNALATEGEPDEGDPMDFHLEVVELKNIDVHKYDEATKVDVETFIYWGNGGFKTEGGNITAHIDTEFELNIVADGDTTYVHDKHFEFHTDVTVAESSGIVTIKPSGITMEHADFDVEGTIDLKNDVTIDLALKGTKPNFDMLIAFAPADLVPVLERYNNAGNIYFNAVVQGPTAHGQIPFIDATFGASEAFLENREQGKRMDELGFKGHFSTGENRNLASMEFSLSDMSAKLESGSFVGDLWVKNFEEPEVSMELEADFNLEFWARFLNLEDYPDVGGSVEMRMKFHDIIDLDHPEHALNDLNRAYFCELKVDKLRLTSDDLPAPLDRLDVHVVMNGKEAALNTFAMQLGNSDLSITGFVSDLPAIVHHAESEVVAHLDIQSNMVDVAQLTRYSEADSTGVDEHIEDLKVGVSFKAFANAFTEAKHLPVGEFFVDSLHAQLKHYPHELHDFHIDILVDDEDLRLKDFTGYIDGSDFHFNGLVHDYSYWMEPELNGDVDLDITLTSDLLRMEDMFAYQGENFVPEDYRHEELENLVLHVNTDMHFRDSNLSSIDIDLDRLEAKMHAHPMRFEDFAGRVHFEDEHLMLQNFHGKIGRTEFDVDMNYFLGDDVAIKKRDNFLTLNANYIDFDQLFNFQFSAPDQPQTGTLSGDSTVAASQHETAFNLYELPFTDMTFDVQVGHFIYHRIDLQKINAQLRTTHNHYIYVDTLNMHAADGKIHMSGYFNGSDPTHIYAKPKLVVEGADIDKLLFKFETHGEDEALSENLHGSLWATINGNIRVYPDFVPNLDESEIHMDVEVLNGRLVNYEPMSMLSDYMGDKDLTNIRFDTLANHMDLTNGLLSIPNMTLESTLGHFDISGQQDMDFNMEYYVRIPWDIIKQGARNKLFGNKQTAAGDTGDDEVIELDPNKKVRYLNMKIHGNLDDFKVTMGKDKKLKS